MAKVGKNGRRSKEKRVGVEVAPSAKTGVSRSTKKKGVMMQNVNVNHGVHHVKELPFV
jgi:hypothetical protein